MLSPPYSPYTGNNAKSVDFNENDRESNITLTNDKNSSAGSSYSSGNSSPLTEFSRTGTPPRGLSESPRSCKAAPLPPVVRKRAASEAAIETSGLTTCWDALKTNPSKYLCREKSLIELYPLRRHSWVGSSLGSGSDESTDSNSPGPAKRGRKPSKPNTASRGGRRRVATPQPSFTASNSDEESKDGSLKVHDVSINQLEDFAPSFNLLPPGKSLRAEWKGAPMDLSNDKDLHLLHPAEQHLASVLRLPCDVYLDSKRRLFAEKVHRLRQGLPFRRTDSQKACRIDVNKASRLFGAFEKIGWLEDELFLQYLE